MAQTEPTFFKTPSELRTWLEQNHDSATDLLVGFYKRGSGKPSITWPELVDEALCFGWIDGVRKGIDNVSYTIRLTPRKSASTWSAVNMKRVGELSKLGLMHSAGLKAFNARREDKSAIYSYEQRKDAKLEDAHEQEFRANKKAWAFFQSQPPWYQRTATYWVVSAKKEETRLKRLATLIEDSANGRTIGPLTRNPKSP